jgi:hypothetical protein
MADVMLDLETLGTRPGCAILSIGAVEFDAVRGKIGPEFYQVVNRASCRKHGLEEDADTLAWWSRQSEDARKVLAEAETSPQGLGGALIMFAKYCEQFGKKNLHVWGLGADFDVPIIAHCFRKLGCETPWLHYNSRCYRTLRAIGGVKAEHRHGIAHNALDDAKTQSLQAINIIRKLGISS